MARKGEQFTLLNPACPLSTIVHGHWRPVQNYGCMRSFSCTRVLLSLSLSHCKYCTGFLFSEHDRPTDKAVTIMDALFGWNFIACQPQSANPTSCPVLLLRLLMLIPFPQPWRFLFCDHSKQSQYWCSIPSFIVRERGRAKLVFLYSAERGEIRRIPSSEIQAAWSRNRRDPAVPNQRRCLGTRPTQVMGRVRFWSLS